MMVVIDFVCFGKGWYLVRDVMVWDVVEMVLVWGFVWFGIDDVKLFM